MMPSHAFLMSFSTYAYAYIIYILQAWPGLCILCLFLHIFPKEKQREPSLSSPFTHPPARSLARSPSLMVSVSEVHKPPWASMLQQPGGTGAGTLQFGWQITSSSAHFSDSVKFISFCYTIVRSVDPLVFPSFADLPCKAVMSRILSNKCKASVPWHGVNECN